MLLLQGPTLFGGVRWTPVEGASLYLGGIATLIGLLAAFGVVARHPDRPAGDRPSTAADDATRPDPDPGPATAALPPG